MHLQTVGLYISLRGGKVVLEDATTGERLRTIEEAEAARAAEAEARAQTEQRAQAEAQARAELAAKLEAIQAELARLKSRPPDLARGRGTQPIGPKAPRQTSAVLGESSSTITLG